MLTIIRANLLSNRSVLAWLSILCGLIFVVTYIMNGHFVLPNFYFAWLTMAMFLQTDEKHNIKKLYCSLPLTRVQVVKARYLGVLVSLVIALSFSLILLLVMTVIPIEGFTPPTPWVSLTDIILVVILMAVLFASILPCYFRWGYNRGLWPGIVLVTLVSIVISWGLNQYVAMKLGKQVLETSVLPVKSAGILDLIISGYVRAYHYFGSTTFLLVICIITVLLVLGSMKLSIKLFKSTDL